MKKTKPLCAILMAGILMAGTLQGPLLQPAYASGIEQTAEEESVEAAQGAENLETELTEAQDAVETEQNGTQGSWKRMTLRMMTAHNQSSSKKDLRRWRAQSRKLR